MLRNSTGWKEETKNTKEGFLVSPNTNVGPLFLSTTIPQDKIT
jgi:hypothetical protein